MVFFVKVIAGDGMYVSLVCVKRVVSCLIDGSLVWHYVDVFIYLNKWRINDKIKFI